MQRLHGFYVRKTHEWTEIRAECGFRDIMESMADNRMKQSCFVVQNSLILQIIFMSLVAITLVGCSSSTTTALLAPAPPKFDPNAPREAITELTVEPAIGAGQGLGAPQRGSVEPIPEAVAVAFEQEVRPKSCRIQDRFDRKALVAYEWGGRSRLGLDIDGISYDSYDVEQVKLEYRLRFDTYRTKKERCRYKSNWQGMVGTGYNELFVREDDTLWQEIDVLENDVEDGWDAIFH
ncbi:MAG: hypothetical protein DHS20C02_09410 [Micavibrio sp.]|nr:MAG: hypothetical protein DHS20C02_09410 [Micavibrio sp.]